MNSILQQDLDKMNHLDYLDYSKLEGKRFLITGSTGVLGSLLVKALLARNSGISVVLPVRNVEKAKKLFGENEAITYVEGSIETFDYDGDVDFIIHAASPTKSKFFVTYPVDTMDTAILGTKAILDYATKHPVESVLYISSMEMYGTLDNPNTTEDDLGYIDPHDVRSSYSEAKRICELYCSSYLSQKNVPVKIARLAMTFGAGLPKEENRVYKYFCSCILNNENIVLKSTGETIINYCYTVDSVGGMLKILTDGQNGEAYNVVSDPTHMTIKDSAEWLVKHYTQDELKVIIDCDTSAGFAPVNQMVLNNNKLKSIGWQPSMDLKDGYIRLFDYLKEEA